MSTVKISELALISQLNANTSNTLFVAVDVPTGVTGKFTGHTLAQGLYSNEILNVGLNQTFLPNTIAQYSLAGGSYIQTNLVNLDDGGTADIVVTANANSGGTDSAYFIDMGFANANVAPGLEFNNLGTALRPLDGYIYTQGNDVGGSPARGGNLIIGATSTNTQIKFIAGGYNSQNIVAKITGDGFKMVNGHPIIFADDTTQNTASSPAVYSQSAYAQTNSAITLGQSAYTKANNALANTNGAVFGGTLNVTGDIRTNGFVYANVIGSSYANTIQWYPSATTPTQTDGQLWYNGNTKNLVADTDIPGDRPGVGKVLYERVYNNSGGLIDANTWVRLAGAVTTNSIPHIVYADAASAANSIVTGFIKNPIANGAYGFSYTKGIVDDLTLSGFIPGDLIFLSTTPGQASNVAPYGQSLSTVALGKVIKDSGVGAKIQVDIIPAPAYGKINGSVMYANNNLLIASNTAIINESAGTLYVPNGLVYNQRNYPAAQTAITLNFQTDTWVRTNVSTNLAVTLGNFVAGSDIVLFITNTSTGGGSAHTITHGVPALNSTVGAATFTLSGTTTARIKYYSFDGDLANTYASISFS